MKFIITQNNYNNYKSRNQKFIYAFGFRTVGTSAEQQTTLHYITIKVKKSYIISPRFLNSETNKIAYNIIYIISVNCLHIFLKEFLHISFLEDLLSKKVLQLKSLYRTARFKRKYLICPKLHFTLKRIFHFSPNDFRVLCNLILINKKFYTFSIIFKTNFITL